MSASTTNASADAQRKRMRKGTRSCLECRTRKIRCIFPPGSRTCKSCQGQSKSCVEQTYSHVREAGLDKRVGLKQRVKELEALVSQLVQKGSEGKAEIPERYRSAQNRELMSPAESSEDARQSSSPVSTTAQIVQDTQAAFSDIYEAVEDDIEDGIGSFDTGFGSSAVKSLFDNAVLSHERNEPSDGDSPRVCTQKAQARHDRVAAELRSLIPNIENLKTLLRPGMILESIASIWRHALTLEVKQFDEPIESILHRHLHSENLSVLAKGLLYYAMLLQQLPDDNKYNQLGFPKGLSGKALIQVYIDTVDQYLVSHDRITGSIEGLESAFIMCQLLTNDGRPRKAWAVFQRTISYAKLLGYHRPSSWKCDDGDHQSLGQRRERLWWMLYLGDRYMSALLGLPYAISDNHVDLTTVRAPIAGGFIDTQSFCQRLASTTGKIIDRNHSQERSTTDALSSAMQLDGELHALSCMVPSSWWDTTGTPMASNEAVYDVYARSKAIFWFCQCRLMLHMPFMMKSLRKEEDSSLYSYSRSISLESSRTMVKCHDHLRTRPEFAGIVCQILDFQVFTAGMFILLDLIERPDFATNHQQTESIADTKVIVSLIGTLRKVSNESNGRCDIAGQAVDVLDSVAHVLYGCPRPKNGKHPSRVIIPYFGAVTIKPANNRKSCKCCPSHDPFQAITPVSSFEGDRTDKSPRVFLCQNQGQLKGAKEVFASDSVLPQDQPESLASSDYITFESFVGFGLNVQGSYGTESWNSSAQLGDCKPETGNIGKSSGQDVNMWDDNVWQAMLEQDPSLELDGDWNWPPQ